MDKFAALIPFILIALLVFIVCREIVCWYWKINRTVQLLEEIAANTRKDNTHKDSHISESISKLG